MSSKGSRSSIETSQRSKDAKFYADCRAAYLLVYESTRDMIKSQNELLYVLQQTGRNPSKRVIKKYWTEKTLQLSFDDFCEILKQEKETTQEDLLKAFTKIDINNDGFITHDELYRVLTSRGEKMSKREVEVMIDEADDDGDRRLNYKEFCKMLMSTTEKVKDIASQKVEKGDRTKRSSKHLDYVRESKKEDSSAASSSLSSNHATPSTRPKVKMNEPKNLKKWRHVKSKGCFYIDDDDKTIISHQYRLRLSKSTGIWLTMQPYGSRFEGEHSEYNPIDTSMFILRENDEGEPQDCIEWTENREKNTYSLRCDLKSGNYRLIPFTTGCRFHARKSQPRSEAKLIKKDRDSDNYVLTKQFRDSLLEIFDTLDLDGNQALSRTEFDFFQLRTTGESCDEENWEVVVENFELKNNELTKNGFLALHQMEANDNDGEMEDLWVTLDSMGYSKDLTLDEACPFIFDIYAEECEAKIYPLEPQEGGSELERALCQSVMKNGKETKIKGSRDLVMHTYIGETLARISIVIENKSRSKSFVRLDCTLSRNCISHRGTLDFSFDIPANSTVVGHHLMPMKENQSWNFNCSESLIP